MSLSTADTHALGMRIGQRLDNGTVLALHGDLGAGKTLMIKGIAEGAAAIAGEVIQSPTFVHLNLYKGQRMFYHFDLYRLRDADAFLSMGFDEYLFTPGICCIEWAERISELLLPNTIHITLTHLGEDRRRIEIPLDQAATLWGRIA